MKLTITKTEIKKGEIEVPKYFKYHQDFYRVDNDEYLTKVVRGDNFNAVYNRATASIEEYSQVTEITECEFKVEFCKAVAEIAGFEFDPTEWQDQESDVHKEVAA